MADKDSVFLTYSEHFSIPAKRKTISLKHIEGLGNGQVYSPMIHPATACLVKKVSNGYRILNPDEPRLFPFLHQYDYSTQIEILLIDEEISDRVSFLANDVIPQTTSNVKFFNFFRNLILNRQHQEWIANFFTNRKSRSNAKLAFNLQTFLEHMGSNTPTKPTLDKLIKEVTSPDFSNSPKAISTPPTQIDVYTTKTTTVNDSQLKTKEQTAPELSRQPDVSSAENSSQKVLSNLEMQEVWDKQSNSKYTYAEIRKHLTSENNNYFTKCLNEISPKSAEFSAFVQSAEALLGGQSHN